MSRGGGTVFITGTGTGVGKTLLTASLTVRLLERGVHVAALKPLASGGRADARLLQVAAGQVLTLDQVNPWWFRASLTPLLAARAEAVHVSRGEVVRHIRRFRASFRLLLVEGAGGLLSPLGEDFDARDLIRDLEATPLIVAPNRLGALHDVLVAWEALPMDSRRRTSVVLMAAPRATRVSRTNAAYLRERIGVGVVFELPYLGQGLQASTNPASRKVKTVLNGLCDRILESGNREPARFANRALGP